MKIKTMFFSLLIFYSGIVLSDFSDGFDAYNQGDYDTAFEEWLPYAEQGDVNAQYNLALVYDVGYKNYQQAAKWYKKAANQDYDKAQYNLALMYRDGDGVSKNYKKSIKWFKKSANQGHAGAQSSLGFAYRWGNRGVDKDYSKALYWTKKAAKQDDVIAQNNLAVAYENGVGIVKDYKESIIWYLKAVDGDYEKAKENLNDLLLKMNGDSNPVYSKAVKDYDNKLYNKAFPKFLWLALRGNAKAQTYIGVMFAKGEWIGKDYKQSVQWYQKAANQGYAVAQYNLAVKYDTGKGISKDKKQAVKWYKKSANQGSQSAQYNLALMYRNGEGVIKDDKKAAAWYIKAAEQGHAKSQANLGLLYDLGEGVEPDHIKALKWYKKAANQNIDTAQYNLGLMYEYGKGPVKNISEAIRWYKKAANQGDDDAKAKVKKLLALQETEKAPTFKEAKEDFDANKFDSAFPKFLRLANQGGADAQGYLGWMYDLGKGTEEDNYEAVKWYKKASEQGVRFAQYNLGLMYEEGEGASKSLNKALKWYRKAASQGDEKAKSKLKKLQDNKYTVFSGSGTGFLVSKNGVFATNHHVIDGCGRIVVDDKDAALVLQDKVNDLALIKVDKTYDKVSRLSYRSPTLGSDISVFGYPLSDMMSDKHISLTKGSVSSLAGMDGNLSNFRFTAPVQPGNSGGPIVNKDGKVVGITRAVLGKTTLEKGDFLPQNVNFGIRSSLLINMMV